MVAPYDKVQPPQTELPSPHARASAATDSSVSLPPDAERGAARQHRHVWAAFRRALCTRGVAGGAGVTRAARRCSSRCFLTSLVGQPLTQPPPWRRIGHGQYMALLQPAARGPLLRRTEKGWGRVVRRTPARPPGRTGRAAGRDAPCAALPPRTSRCALILRPALRSLISFEAALGRGWLQGSGFLAWTRSARVVCRLCFTPASWLRQTHVCEYRQIALN